MCLWYKKKKRDKNAIYLLNASSERVIQKKHGIAVVCGEKRGTLAWSGEIRLPHHNILVAQWVKQQSDHLECQWNQFKW